LKKAGFKKITFFNKNHLTNDPVIKRAVVDEGVSHSLLVEAYK